MVAVRTRFFRFQAARTVAKRLTLNRYHLKIETWSVQGVRLGMYVPAFLSLNKKQAKSENILKAKCLGSIEHNKLRRQNTLDPEDLTFSIVRAAWKRKKRVRTATNAPYGHGAVWPCPGANASRGPCSAPGQTSGVESRNRLQKHRRMKVSESKPVPIWRIRVPTHL